jgi:hypothetical protein
MAVADNNPKNNLFQPQDRPVLSVAISLPKDDAPPGATSFGRIPFLPRTGEVASASSPARHPTGKTRQPFRRCLVPSTTCQHANQKPTALQVPGRLPPLLLRPLSPTTAFQAPGQPHARHRLPAGCCNGSQVIDGLRSTGHVASGFDTTEQSSYVPGSRPAIVARRLTPSFQGPKVEASLYPSTISVRSSASSPVKLTGKPLMGLSWLSYSWSPDLPEIPGRGHTPGSACCQARNSPRQLG